MCKRIEGYNIVEFSELVEKDRSITEFYFNYTNSQKLRTGVIKRFSDGHARILCETTRRRPDRGMSIPSLACVFSTIRFYTTKPVCKEIQDLKDQLEKISARIEDLEEC